MPVVKYKNLGLIDYKEAWEYQENLFKGTVDQKIRIRKEESTEPTQNYILFCEHPHVYTLGKSGKKDTRKSGKVQSLCSRIFQHFCNFALPVVL